MRNARISVFMVSLFYSVCCQLFAVEPLQHESIEFRAPSALSKMGVVEVWDIKKNRMIWEQQVYKVQILPFISEKWQLQYISKLEWENGKLKITTDRDHHYLLDPASRHIVALELQIPLLTYILIGFFFIMFIIIACIKFKSKKQTQLDRS